MLTKTGNGGTGLSRETVKELLRLFKEAQTTPLSFETLADVDRFEESLEKEVGLQPLEPVDITDKEQDATPVILWCRQTWACVADLFSNPANAEGFVAELEDSSESEEAHRFTEPSTGSFWREAVAGLPDGASIAAVILYSDATELAKDGSATGHPVYVSLGNISSGERWKPHGRRLAALLPDFSKHVVKPGVDVARRRLEIFHTCLEKILEKQKEVESTGMRMKDPLGVVRYVRPLLYAYVGDYPEQCKVAGTKMGNQTRFPCPKCLISNENLANADARWEYRTEEGQKLTLAQLQAFRGRTALARAETVESTHRVKVGIWGFPNGSTTWGNPYRSLMCDVMHMSALGVYKHMVDCIRTMLPDKIAAMDIALRNVTAFSRQSLFRLPSEGKHYFANRGVFQAFEHQSVMQVLPIILELVNAPAAIREVVSLYVYWHTEVWLRPYHTEDSLDVLDLLTKKLVAKLVDVFGEQQSSEFNLPKIARKALVAELVDILARQEEGAEDSAARNGALSQALQTGCPAVTGKNGQLALLGDRSSLWQAYAHTIPGNMEQLLPSIMSFLGPDRTCDARVNLHRGVAVPPGENYEIYNRHAQFARATPLFYGRPWFSDVAVTDHSTDDADAQRFCKLLLMFTLTNGEECQQVAFVRFYNVLGPAEGSVLDRMTWASGDGAYGIVPVDDILRVLHVAPLTDDVRNDSATFLYNPFRR
ncbi:hypothetical protein CLOP_g23090 [Closterium sp. NIES-67]|nr:hypothetical protein CLOP_g23090 [Closterium sp. NIES-67]